MPDDPFSNPPPPKDGLDESERPEFIKFEKWARHILLFVFKHAGAVVFCLSLLVTLPFILIAWIGYGSSILYPLREIAFRDKELEHRQFVLEQEKADFARKKWESDFGLAMATNQVALAKSFLDVGQFAEAQTVYEQALKYDATNVEAIQGLFKAQAYKPGAGQDGYASDIVLRRLNAVLEAAPSDPHALAAKANIMQSIDPDDAEWLYRRAIEADNGVAFAHFGLANLLIKDRAYAEARKHLERAVAISPWKTDYLNNLAYVLAQLGEPAAAVAHYQKALALDGDYLLPYVELVNVLRERGDFETALAYQRHALRLLDDDRVSSLPKNQAPWFFNGDPAPVHLDTLDEKRFHVRCGLATTYCLMGDIETAETHVDEAKKLSASFDPEPIVNLASFEMKKIWARTIEAGGETRPDGAAKRFRSLW